MAGQAMRCPHCGGAFQAPAAPVAQAASYPLATAAPAPVANSNPTPADMFHASSAGAVPSAAKATPDTPRRKSSVSAEAIKIIVGGILGLAIGWVVVVKVIFPMQQRGGEPAVVAQKAAEPPEVNSPSAPPHRPQESPRPSKPASPSAEEPPLTKAAEPKPLPADQPPAVPPPVTFPPTTVAPPPTFTPPAPSPGSPASSPPATPLVPSNVSPPSSGGNPFAQLPLALKMPSPVATVAQPVATFSSAFADQLEIALNHALADLGEAAAFAAARSDNSATTWHVHYLANKRDESAPKRKLGQFELAERELRYVWDQIDEQTPWKQLANCQIVLTSGEHRHVAQLREPKREEAITLDLDKTKDVRKIAVGTLPKPEHVQLSLEKLANFPSGASIKGERRTLAPGQEAVIEFASQPGAAVEVKFTRQVDETYSVIVSPVFKEKGSDDIPMTNQRLQDMAEAADKWLREAEVIIPQLEEEFILLRGELGRAQSRAKGATGAAYVTATRNVSAINSRLDACGRRLKRMKQQAPEMTARQAAVPAIKSLMGALHTKAKLELKIVASQPDGSALALVEMR